MLDDFTAGPLKEVEEFFLKLSAEKGRKVKLIF